MCSWIRLCWLPLLAHIASKNFYCTGYDKDVIKNLKENKIKFYEKFEICFIKSSKIKQYLYILISERLRPKYIVCIGSYLNRGQLDNKVFYKVLNELIKFKFKENDLLIIRGTVNVGFSREVANYIKRQRV